jgi:urease alpha subunit
MKRINDLSTIFVLVLGAAAAGCTTEPPDAGGGLTGAGDEVDDGDDTATTPLDAAGTYRLQSKLDLAASVPGTACEVVSKIIEITDGPDDPTRWILDQAIGQVIAAVVGMGGASTYTAACKAGLDRGADYIYSKLAAIDGAALDLGLAGTARAIDKDRDGGVDTLAAGAWTGTISYGGEPAPLAGATFFGARM